MFTKCKKNMLCNQSVNYRYMWNWDTAVISDFYFFCHVSHQFPQCILGIRSADADTQRCLLLISNTHSCFYPTQDHHVYPSCSCPPLPLFTFPSAGRKSSISAPGVFESILCQAALVSLARSDVFHLV